MSINIETRFLEAIEHKSKEESVLKHPAAQDDPIQSAFQPDSLARFYHKPSHGSMKLSGEAGRRMAADQVLHNA
ncbi:MAG TPA: hypothetical protein VGA86_03055, partial [Desulfatiglandales bacterium]